MITFFLITGLVLSLGLNITAFILLRIQLSKISTYESWILETKTSLITTIEKMREIDKIGTFATSMNDKGTFESDDQVGQIFKELLDLVEKLDNRIQ